MNSLLSRLTGEVLNNAYFLELLELLLQSNIESALVTKKTESEPDEKQLLDILRFFDILSFSGSEKVRNLTINAVDAIYVRKRVDDEVLKRIAAIFVNLGIFPSLALLEDFPESLTGCLPFDRRLVRDAKRLAHAVPFRDGLYFTDIQFDLFKKISRSDRFSISGPTSLGKSFVVEAFLQGAIQEGGRPNVCIVVPTRALIAQFSMSIAENFAASLEIRQYVILSNSNIEKLLLEGDTRFILVVTPERLIAFLSEKDNPKLDYLFVDEAHKLAANLDTRSITLFSAVNQCLRLHKPKVFFSSPYVSNPEVFLDLFSLRDGDGVTQCFKTGESPVAQNIFFLDLLKGSGFYKSALGVADLSQRIKDERITADDFLTRLGKGAHNIVYCNSKSDTRGLCHEFFTSQSKLADIPPEIDQSVRRAISQIKQYVHKDYYLASYLSMGVAFHFGTIPQIIRTVIEDLFKEQKISYLFCTSTLLEGVNLPARNVFILSDRKGPVRMEPVDLWNLAGRAGRLGKDLGGNVFCVRIQEKNWKKTDFLDSKEAIELTPTITERAVNDSLKLECSFKDESFGDSQAEREVLNHLAGLLAIESHATLRTLPSPIRRLLDANGKEELLALSRDKIESITVPFWILQKHESIRLRVQENVFRFTQREINSDQAFLPKEINYESVLNVLETFWEIYDWGVTEPELLNGAKDPNKQKSVLKYLAVLLNNWIAGNPLSLMIVQAIEYNKRQALKQKEFYVDRKPVGLFREENPGHVNSIINDLIEDVENKVRYNLQKYFDHYHSILLSTFGEDRCGPNWAVYLEYGSRDTLVISLQNLGLSRHVANVIRARFAHRVKTLDGKLISVDWRSILASLEVDSIEYFEISRLKMFSRM